MSGPMAKSSPGTKEYVHETAKYAQKKDKNGDPLKTAGAEGGQDQLNASEETEYEEKIVPMTDREEKMSNYREQVEEMRRRITTLEDENRKLASELDKKEIKFIGVEDKRKNSFRKYLPRKNERPKTAVYPAQHKIGFETTELPNERDEHKSQIRQLQDEKDTLGTKLKHYENELNSVKEENRIAKETISKLKKEKDDLFNRLSEIASDRLSHENTDIVDLSDENRPGKLKEKMAEMYDYQWTHALDELQANGFENEKAIQLLLKILMDTHAACKEVTWNRYLKLTADCSSIMLPWQLESDAKGEENGVIVNVDLSLEQKRHIKQICFGASKALESKIRPMIMKMVEVKVNLHVEHIRQTRRYLEDCIELCWKMTLQEKPMHLDMNAEIKDAQRHFDNEKFRSYTKTGKNVDFVVWPALYLFEGGPMLTRGIAQGLREKESESL